MGTVNNSSSNSVVIGFFKQASAMHSSDIQASITI